jgi:hypothetical protein
VEVEFPSEFLDPFLRLCFVHFRDLTAEHAEIAKSELEK